MIGILFAHAVIRIGLALTALFVALLGALHLQPYDDSGLRALVTPPDDCAAPCFMGIQPGITRAGEAVALLWAHEWVGEVREFTSPRGRRTIYWTWSGQQPDLINPERRGFLIVYQDIVRDVRVHTLAPLHHALLLYGAPDYGYVFGGPFGSPNSRFYQLVFEAEHVHIHFDRARSSWDSCPPDLWTANAEISFVARSPYFESNGFYDPCLRTLLFDSL